MSELIEYKELSLTHNELKQTVELLNKCFPTASKFSLDYLSWLYIDNPAGKAVGYNAYCNGNLVGHYSCIPLKAVVSGKPVNGLLSLNTATDPSFQGKGLFRKLANMTYKVASEASFKFVCGVANSRSTKLFIKLLKFQLVSPLDVKIGYGNYFKKIDNHYIENNCEFYPVWNKELIEWRVNNPNNRCYSNRGDFDHRFYAQTHMPFIKNEAFCYYDDQQNYNVSEQPFSSRFHAKVIMALTPNNNQIKSGLFISLPERLKPSPLNFIFKSLTNENISLHSSNVLFTFLDFDAY